MATSRVSVESQDDKLRLQEVDESLRKKYLDIVMSLDISELRIFSKQKYRYKKLVMSDMFELVPGAEKQAVDDASQYVSNMLGNEAKRKLVKKTSEEQSSKLRQTRSSL